MSSTRWADANNRLTDEALALFVDIRAFVPEPVTPIESPVEYAEDFGQPRTPAAQTSLDFSNLSLGHTEKAARSPQSPTPSRRPDIVHTDAAATPEPSHEAYRPAEKQSHLAFIHYWTQRERVALCTLKRWFLNNWLDITAILNKVFRQSISQRETTGFRDDAVSKAWSEIKFYRIRPEWRYVFQRNDFERPQPDIIDLKDELASAAEILGIDLEPRENEEKELLVPRSLKNFKAHYCRQKFISFSSIPDYDPYSREREAVLEELPFSQSQLPTPPITPHGPQPPLTTPSGPPATQSGQATFPLTPSRPPLQRSWHNPSALYRYWDAESAGLNTPTCFRAGRYNDGLTFVPAPPSSDHGTFISDAWHHLSERRLQIHSPFVSVTNSLVWVLHKAAKSVTQGRDPHIAVISTSTLQQHTPIYLVHPLIGAIKRAGYPYISRYKGLNEWLVWGQIPETAILGDVPYTTIQQHAANVPSIRRLLRLELLRPELNIGQIRQTFIRGAVRMDVDTARATAVILQLLRLSASTSISTSDILVDAVYHIVQGWALRDGPADRNWGRVITAFTAGMNCTTEEETEGFRAAFVAGIQRARWDLDGEIRRIVPGGSPSKRKGTRPQQRKLRQKL